MNKILIIGGGIGGLTAAIALRQKGLDAHVYEWADELETVGLGIWVTPNALMALDGLGIAETISERGVPLEHVDLRDKKDGMLSKLDLVDFKAKFGHTTISIHRGRLQNALADNLPEDAFHLGKQCTGFKQDVNCVTAHFADGSEAVGELLIGADGIHSVVRKAMFPEVALRYSGQTCYRGVAKMELPDKLKRTCWEVWGGRFRFGFSSIGPNEVYWFAPFTAPAGAMPVEKMPEDVIGAYSEFPEPIPRIIANTPVDGVILTDLHDFAPTTSWHEGRVLLIGDAAHAMTPNLGQGGAQAIEDACVLAEMLSTFTSFGEAFREFERERMPRVRWIVNNAWRFGRLAHITSRPLQKIRNASIKYTPERVNRKQVEWLYRFNG